MTLFFTRSHPLTPFFVFSHPMTPFLSNSQHFSYNPFHKFSICFEVFVIYLSEFVLCLKFLQMGILPTVWPHFWSSHRMSLFGEKNLSPKKQTDKQTNLVLNCCLSIPINSNDECSDPRVGANTVGNDTTSRWWALVLFTCL